MIKAVELLNEKLPIQVFLLKANSIENDSILEFLKTTPLKITIIEQERGADLINSSDMVLTTCGTSNLEIALTGVPFIAVYRVNSLSYLLGIHFVKIRLYSIVNILAGERVIPELIQKNFKAEKIVKEVMNIINNQELQKQMLAKFSHITKKLKKDKSPEEIIYQKISSEIF
jgi:lipid-A-disaccharide synthase